MGGWAKGVVGRWGRAGGVGEDGTGKGGAGLTRVGCRGGGWMDSWASGGRGRG